MTAAPLDSLAMTPPERVYRDRRERVLLVLTGIFLASMAMLNILGLTRFVQIGPLSVAVGVLPYPITFLCTDLIGEFYGRRRAAFVVWTGFLINAFVISFVWLGDRMPAVPEDRQPPHQSLELAESFTLPNGEPSGTEVELFHIVYTATAASVLASMAAYLAAQFCDVFLFHFWKRVTKGKHLWLRNNGSTLGSQLVDSVVVISIVFGRPFAAGEMALGTFVGLMLSNYAFKALAALVDTGPFYLAVRLLGPYLGLRGRTLDEEESGDAARPRGRR